MVHYYLHSDPVDYHRPLPIVGATPDGISVLSQMAFELFIGDTFLTLHSPSEDGAGMPHVIHEMKTFHRPLSFIVGGDIDWVMNKSLWPQDGGLQQIVSLLGSKLKAIDVLSNNTAADVFMRKYQFITRDELPQKVPDTIYKESLRTRLPYVNRNVDISEKVGLDPDRVTEYAVELTKMKMRPGGACITVFPNNDANVLTPVHTFYFAKAPFILSPVGTFMMQMMTQALCTFEYNANATMMFTCCLQYPPQTRTPVRVALAYSYDTGIDWFMVQDYIDRTLSEICKLDPILHKHFTANPFHLGNAPRLNAPSSQEEAEKLLASFFQRINCFSSTDA